METHINIFHALGDPTRLRIVEAMKSGECAVGDIVERMDIHQSGVSRHLRILTEAGVVRMRPDGQKRLYSLRKEAFDQLEAWVAGAPSSRSSAPTPPRSTRPGPCGPPRPASNPGGAPKASR